jgi:hypothetical protein
VHQEHLLAEMSERAEEKVDSMDAEKDLEMAETMAAASDATMAQGSGRASAAGSDAT